MNLQDVHIYSDGDDERGESAREERGKKEEKNERDGGAVTASARQGGLLK